MSTVTIERGLPAWIDGERAILGSLLKYHASHSAAFSILQADDFSIEKHRRIYAAMQALDLSGAVIDDLTLTQELQKRKHLEAVDGLSYLVSLDDGLPEFPSIERYIDGVKEKAALRRIVFTSQSLMNRAMDPAEDSVAIIASAERTFSEIGRPVDSDTADLLNLGEVVEKAGGLEAFINPKASLGAKTPWTRLTEMTGGYRRGELFVIAGNTSHGKSAAAVQVAMGVAEEGRGVLIFSLEMSRASLALRMACCRARVDSGKVRAGYLNGEERMRLRRAINEFSTWPLWIAEHGISTVSGIRAAVRKKRPKSDVFMVVIDYLQLLQSIGRASNRNAEITEITRSIKLLAVDENVNVQLLSQLNRDNLKDKRAPALHDLRESGSIEQDADAVLFVWREEMLKRDREDLRGLAEMILGKQRNGPTGKINLIYINQFTKFENRAEDLPDEGPSPTRRLYDDD